VPLLHQNKLKRDHLFICARALQLGLKSLNCFHLVPFLPLLSSFFALFFNLFDTISFLKKKKTQDKAKMSEIIIRIGIISARGLAAA
jgi:hypothetical protein